MPDRVWLPRSVDTAWTAAHNPKEKLCPGILCYCVTCSAVVQSIACDVIILTSCVLGYPWGQSCYSPSSWPLGCRATTFACCSHTSPLSERKDLMSCSFLATSLTRPVGIFALLEFLANGLRHQFGTFAAWWIFAIFTSVRGFVVPSVYHLLWKQWLNTAGEFFSFFAVHGSTLFACGARFHDACRMSAIDANYFPFCSFLHLQWHSLKIVSWAATHIPCMTSFCNCHTHKTLCPVLVSLSVVDVVVQCCWCTHWLFCNVRTGTVCTLYRSPWSMEGDCNRCKSMPPKFCVE